MKSAQEFVKYLFRRLPRTELIAGTYYCTTDGDIGSIPAHYLMGTTGQKANQWRLDYAYNKYYSTAAYGSWTRAAYDTKTQPWITEGAYLYDCNGLLDAFVEQDNNAAGNYVNWCGIKDDEALAYIMSNGEYAAGACVFKRNSAGRIYHVGFVAGETGQGVPLIIEAKSLNDGITMSTINDGWNEYGIPNRILEFPERSKTKFQVTSPMAQGTKYEAMQRALTLNGYDCGGIDGKWGNNSQHALEDMIAYNRNPMRIKMTINGETVVNMEK